MIRRVRRSVAWRFWKYAVALADPEDRQMWRKIGATYHNAPPRAPDAERYPGLAPVRQDEVLNFCRSLAPFDVLNHEKARLGGSNDGGYVFIDDFDDISTVISCGISNDVSCDLAFAEMGKDIVQFDHTVDGPPIPHSRFDFRQQAIDELRKIPRSTRLTDVIRKLGDAGKSDLLLKIDIEGYEWPTFANVASSDLQRCRQIACEFHASSELSGRESFAIYDKAREVLLDGFFPAHIHANNFAGFSVVAGIPIPEVFEITFVNRRFYQPGQRQKTGPLAVDAPNDATAPDLFLGSPFALADD